MLESRVTRSKLLNKPLKTKYKQIGEENPETIQFVPQTHIMKWNYGH